MKILFIRGPKHGLIEEIYSTGFDRFETVIKGQEYTYNRLEIRPHSHEYQIFIHGECDHENAMKMLFDLIPDFKILNGRPQEFYFSNPHWSGRVKSVFVQEKNPSTKKAKYLVTAQIKPDNVENYIHIEFLTDLQDRVESGIDPVEVCKLWVVPYLTAL